MKLIFAPTRIHSIAAVAAVLMTLCAALMGGQDAAAQYCAANRDYCSSSEGWGNSFAPRWACANGGPNYYGAMWFNNTGNEQTNDSNGYYANSVYIASGASSVSVNLRGSVLSCGTAGYGSVWASEIQPTGPEGWRLGNLSSRSLYRGELQGYGLWSTKGASISATLNVSGLATNNNGRTDSQTITITLWRCFSRDGINRAGSCYGQPVVVTVVRAPRPVEWTINGQSYIKKNSTTDRRQGENAVTAVPGDTLRWDHDLRNNGPNNMDRNVTINVDRQDRSLATGSQLSFNSNPSGMTGRGNAGVLFHTNYNIAHTVTQNDVGEKLCQRIAWRDRAWNASGQWGTSSYACANVPYNYALTPEITAPQPEEIVDSDRATIDVRGTVTNSGPTKSHTNIQWRITMLEYAPSTSISSIPRKSGGVSSSDPCAYFTGNTACTTPGSGTNPGGFGQNGSETYTATAQRSDEAVGTKICFSLSVRRHSSSASNGSQWRHAALHCLVIGKSPKVQVWGGGVSVGRSFPSGALQNSDVMTSLTTKQGVLVPPSAAEMAAAERATKRYWHFGDRAMLDFGSSGSSFPTAGTAPAQIPGWEGVTTVTNKSGVLQFYTDGQTILRRDGTEMETGLMGSGTTTQAAAAFPLSGNRYMLVTSSALAEASLKGELRYSIIDMNLNGGRGGVILKNAVLGTNSSRYIGEALSVAPNAAGDGYWVVVNESGTNRVLSFAVPYALSGSLNQSPVVSAVGGVSGGVNAPGFGAINFNQDYTRAVLTNSFTQNIRVFNFRDTDGRFFQTATWRPNPSSAVYAADFSPSSTYIYTTALYTGADGKTGTLTRYRSDGTGEARIANLPAAASDLAGGASGGGQVKRGPDGRMYMANRGWPRIGVISDPDNANSSAIGWNINGRSLAGGAVSRFGLPQTVAIVRAYLEDPPQYTAMTYGSWSEYGIFAPGEIRWMASGSGLNGGNSSSLQTSWSALSFTYANGQAPCAEPYGCYTPANSTLPDVAALFPASSAGLTITGASTTPQNLASSPNHIVTTSRGTLTIDAGTLTSGRWAVLNVPNTHVIINGNLTYSNGPFANSSQIPQLIIIARDITINTDVTRVDAWLIATRALSTCNERGNAMQLISSSYYNSSAARLTSSQCNRRLTVNGPVMADRLFLRRTAGSDNATPSDPNRPGNPGEIFNLRADAFLWARARMTSQSVYQTTNLQELPPRY